MTANCFWPRNCIALLESKSALSYRFATESKIRSVRSQAGISHFQTGAACQGGGVVYN